MQTKKINIKKWRDKQFKESFNIPPTFFKLSFTWNDVKEINKILREIHLKHKKQFFSGKTRDMKWRYWFKQLMLAKKNQCYNFYGQDLFYIEIPYNVLVEVLFAFPLSYIDEIFEYYAHLYYPEFINIPVQKNKEYFIYAVWKCIEEKEYKEKFKKLLEYIKSLKEIFYHLKDDAFIEFLKNNNIENIDDCIKLFDNIQEIEKLTE